MESEAPKRIWLCPQNYESATACCHPSDTEYVRADLATSVDDSRASVTEELVAARARLEEVEAENEQLRKLKSVEF